MKRENVFFINKEGKKISDENIDFHQILAEKILDENSELKKEFELSGEKSPTIFLIVNGYLCGTESYSENKMYIMYNCLYLTDITRNILGEFKENGHKIYDIIRNELNPQQLELIKKWYKEEENIEAVMNRVKRDIFKWNIPEKISKKDGFEK